MDNDLISVIDVASHHGKQKQHIFKILKRLSIDTIKIRNSSSKNQRVSYITQDEFKRVSEALLSFTERINSEQSDEESERVCFF